MKMVTAIIRPEKLDAVREALIAAEITRLSVSRCTGHGRAAESQLYRGQVVVPELTPKVRLDIACNDEFVDVTIDAIMKSAQTDALGDGKIFVTHLEQVIRIRTEERGGAAI